MDIMRFMGVAQRTLVTLSTLALMCACSDGEYERMQRRAEFNQRFVNAAMPRLGEPTECEITHDHLVCYPKGKRRQPIPVAAVSEIP